jgi:hypothetical protein
MNFPANAFILAAACLAVGCDRNGAGPSLPRKWDLLGSALLSQWQQSGIPDEGSMQVTANALTLPAGLPMTGCKFAAWQALGMPGTDYAIEYEAMRVDGDDIFGMCTFPVSSHSGHATFVIGGWGGTLTGISSIDFKDASENSTRAEQKFANGVWHHVRIEVRPEDIRAWVNGRPVVNVSIKGRQVGLRPGYIDHCLPFGFATWNTEGRIRGVKVHRL